jgi:hypothetical protein
MQPPLTEHAAALPGTYITLILSFFLPGEAE